MAVGFPHSTHWGGNGYNNPNDSQTHIFLPLRVMSYGNVI